MISDWFPTLFKVAIAVGIGAAVYHFLPSSVTTAVQTSVTNFLGQLP